jgi:hypothetical protein
MSNNTQPLADEVRDAVRVQLTKLLRVGPESSYRIAEFSQHQAD